MNVKQLRESGMIMFDAIAGSHAYGTNIPTSDVDYRGIFLLPDSYYLSMEQPPQQVSDEKHDTTYYSLKRFFELTAKATPNTLELLWMPDDTVQYESEAFKHLRANRDLFISKKCYYTFTGYAHAQIKKAKGQNKWVNNPQPKERPNKLDFCWFIDTSKASDYNVWSRSQGAIVSTTSMDEFIDKHGFPMRPKAIKDTDIDLSKYHASSMEHCNNMYRLYWYGDNAKGVFRGPSQQMVMESIPKEGEWDRFDGLLIYNEEAYERAVRDHKHYWEWVANRNEARWETQEAGKIDYDAKNMLHCVRLIQSSKNILENGAPIVRFKGKELEYLMNIRKGKYTHEEIMDYCEDQLVQIEYLYQKSDAIPKAVDMKKIHKLYKDLRGLSEE
jgi:predicted nucleotidyltransferase